MTRTVALRDFLCEAMSCEAMFARRALVAMCVIELTRMRMHVGHSSYDCFPLCHHQYEGPHPAYPEVMEMSVKPWIAVEVDALAPPHS